MFRNTAQFLWMALVLSAVVVLPGCPGAKPAPISGYTPLGAVSVMVIVPQSTAIGTGTTQQFTATINNSAVSGVQWEVNGIPGGVLNGVVGNAGTIDSLGNYTAPVLVPPNPQVTITAVADADNTKSGSATVTITGAQLPPTVTVSPKSADVQIGTKLNLTASVTGSTDTSVIWQVNGIDDGNSTVGTIAPGSNDTAVYTAPAKVPNPATVTITAVSHANPSVSASLTVTISAQPPNNATVTIFPLTATVKIGTQFNFTASVIGVTDTSVSWQVNGQTGGNSIYGTVLGSGTNDDTGTYTAPSAVPSAGDTVTVTAVSNAQPSKTASAIVTIAPGSVNSVTISISPPSATVATGAEQDFQAQVNNATNTSVTWQVNGVTGGNSTYGTIVPNAQTSNDAVYSAPTTLPTNPNVVVSAIPNADTSISATASVTLFQPKVGVTLSPSSVLVKISQMQNFTAAITGTSGTGSEGATWYVNNVLGGNGTVGTITNDGTNEATYTAPASVPSPAAVTIKAVSTADSSAFGTATVTIVGSTVVTISCVGNEGCTGPATATIQYNDGICNSPCGANFDATVTGLSNTAVNWYANGELDGDPTTNGTISPATGPCTASSCVVYTSPTTQPSSPVIITAVAADGTVSNQAVVTITPPPPPKATISISPLNPPVPPSGTVQFSANLQNTGEDNIVNWALSGPAGGCTGALCGTLTITSCSAGSNTAQTSGFPVTYCAPMTPPVPPTATITATADFSSSLQANTTITIAYETATISISPGSLTAVAGSGSSNPFTATLQNVDPSTTEVTWSLGCDSLAPPPTPFINYNCGDFLSPGSVGPGCITDGKSQPICSNEGTISDLETVSISYTPPGSLGSNFQVNSCTETQGTNGMVPLTASIAGLPNCSPDESSCLATVCITVTPP